MSESPGEETTKISIEVDDAIEAVTGETFDFPKYTRTFLNRANRFSQATRPPVVGKVTDLFQECPERTVEGWKEWYQEKHPDAIDDAVKKMKPMIENFRDALENIDEDIIRKWVRDLVIYKTAKGLLIQEAVLKELARRTNKSWEPAGPADESKNIDGYIGETPVSIKPESYREKEPDLLDNIEVPIIFYNETQKYLHNFVDNMDELG